MVSTTLNKRRNGEFRKLPLSDTIPESHFLQIIFCSNKKKLNGRGDDPLSHNNIPCVKL